jgi:hypothetical protein
LRKSWSEGRNLGVLYDRIQDHGLRGISVTDRRVFAEDDGKPVVMKIEAKKVPQEREQLTDLLA